MKRTFSSTLFWVGFALLVTLAGAVGAWVRYHPPNLLLVWKPFLLTQHQFDYELEFVKRGFVGEAFRLAGIARTVTAVSVCSWAIAGLLATSLVRFHRRFAATPLGDRTAPFDSIWLWSIFLCPATFLQAGGDLGRLDPVLLLCEIGLLIQATHPGWRWAPVAMLLTWIGIATHELFLLAQLPLVLAGHGFIGWQYPQRRRESYGRGVVILAAAVVGAGVIAAFGRMDGNTPEQYMSFLQEHRGLAEPNAEGVAVLYKSLGENIGFAWQKLAAKAPWGIPCAAAVTLCYLGLGFAAARWQKSNALLIAVGAIGPLLLLALAYDYGRWFSFSTINILLAVSVCQQNPGVTVNWKPLRWTWLFALLGPFGVTVGFPWWL